MSTTADWWLVNQWQQTGLACVKRMRRFRRWSTGWRSEASVNLDVMCSWLTGAVCIGGTGIEDIEPSPINRDTAQRFIIITFIRHKVSTNKEREYKVRIHVYVCVCVCAIVCDSHLFVDYYFCLQSNKLWFWQWGHNPVLMLLIPILSDRCTCIGTEHADVTFWIIAIKLSIDGRKSPVTMNTCNTICVDAHIKHLHV